MTFSISLGCDHIDPASGAVGFEGEIRLGKHSESFIALGTYWTRADYEAHWHHALLRILQGHLESCLITSIQDPNRSHLLFWWPLYPEDDVIRVQNGILFFEQLNQPFSVEDPFASIPQRRVRTPEGVPISEWEIGYSDVSQFLASRSMGDP